MSKSPAINVCLKLQSLEGETRNEGVTFLEKELAWPFNYLPSKGDVIAFPEIEQATRDQNLWFSIRLSGRFGVVATRVFELESERVVYELRAPTLRQKEIALLVESLKKCGWTEAENEGH